MSAYRSGFGDLLEPGFREIFDDRYEEIPQTFPEIFNVESSDKQDEKDSAVSGFGYWLETDQGGQVNYEDPVQMYDVNDRLHHRVVTPLDICAVLGTEHGQSFIAL